MQNLPSENRHREKALNAAASVRQFLDVRSTHLGNDRDVIMFANHVPLNVADLEELIKAVRDAYTW